MNRNKGDYDPTRETLQEYGARTQARITQEKEEAQDAQRKAIDEASIRLRAEREQKKDLDRRRQAEYLAEQQAQTAARQAQQERLMKADARSHYAGTDASFESDWPGIRSKLAAETIAMEAKASRQRALREF